MHNWYCATLQPGLGSTAAMHLERQDFESYLPIGKEHIGDGRMKEYSLFPGYIFVRFDVELDRWRAINGTRGVVRLMPKHHEIPLSLPLGFIETLRARQLGGELDAKVAEEVVHVYARGEAVEGVSGPWVGHTGEFVRYRRGSLVLLVSLFGRKHEVLRPEHEFRPAPAIAA